MTRTRVAFVHKHTHTHCITQLERKQKALSTFIDRFIHPAVAAAAKAVSEGERSCPHPPTQLPLADGDPCCCVVFESLFGINLNGNRKTSSPQANSLIVRRFSHREFGNTEYSQVSFSINTHFIIAQAYTYFIAVSRIDISIVLRWSPWSVHQSEYHDSKAYFGS